MRVDLTSKPLDLTGVWRVAHRVESSRRADFLGLDIEFQCTFLQDSQQIAGEGEKFLVDRQPARPGEVSQLAITGWVDREDVRISLMEISPHGRPYTIIGEIIWKAIDADHMVGSFRVDLADTRGRSEAQRQTG
jgi:hypothetical protein